MTDTPASQVAPRLRSVAEERHLRRERMKLLLLREAERIYADALSFDGPRGRMARIYAHAIEEAADRDNLMKLRHLAFMKRVPVTIDEFCESREFMGNLQEIWPALRDDLRDMNPDVFTGAACAKEAMLGGATGTGKTTLSYTTNAYQAYLFECFNTPQRLYNLTPVTPIVFMFQSVSEAITRRIIYRPFRDLFTQMPFVQRWLNWDKNRESELLFDSGLTIVPALAKLEAILGQAIAGAMLDEVNFMRIIQNSKQVAGSRGGGGLFDQAREVYDNITRRQQRSFETRGYHMGVICSLSSTRYENDFLDKRMAEVKKHSIPNIIVKRRKQYEVVPKDRFTGEKFSLLVGNNDYRTMVIEEGMKPGIDYPEGAEVERVPVEYRQRFLTDPEGALRDVIGKATAAIAPFIGQRHKVLDAVIRFRELGHKALVKRAHVDLAKDGMPQWNGEVLEAMPKAVKDKPRFVHIDLSKSVCDCGIGVVRLDGFENRRTEEGVLETVPILVVEAAVGIKPSRVKEIDMAEVRRWVMLLHSFYGLNIYAVTYDGYQSVESQQAIQKAGVRTWNVSMDTSTDPYMELRRCFYEDRISMPDVEHLRVELSQLEMNSEKEQVDHPPNGSKDTADGVCGAVYACRTSRLVRVKAGARHEDGEPIRRGDGRSRDTPRPK